MKKFSKVSEAQVTRAIVDAFTENFKNHIRNDVIVVGGGPSGLTAARDLAKAGKKVLIIEANNYLGGGFWLGGYLMNPLSVRHPGEEILDEVGVPYKEVEKGHFIAEGPHACSKLIAAACDAGVKILNMTKFDDAVIRDGKIAGTVINWTPVSSLPRQISCVDPVALESDIVIDASGHDAVVCSSLEKRDLMKTKGCGAMWVEESEDQVVEKTGEVYPGLIICGMAVSTVYGIPRMGPTFGAMLVSGKKAAQLALEKLKGRIKKIKELEEETLKA